MNAAEECAWEQERAAELARHALAHEAESCGIADGMRRRGRDPSYVHVRAYRCGYAKGLLLPAELAPDEDESDSEDDPPCRMCGDYGYHDDGEDMVPCGHCRIDRESR